MDADVKERLQGGKFAWYTNPVQSVKGGGHLEHVQVFWRPRMVNGQLVEDEIEELESARETVEAGAGLAASTSGAASSLGAASSGSTSTASALGSGNAMDVSEVHLPAQQRVASVQLHRTHSGSHGVRINLSRSQSPPDERQEGGEPTTSAEVTMQAPPPPSQLSHAPPRP